MSKLRFCIIAAMVSLALFCSPTPAWATFQLTIQAFNSSNASLGSVVIADGSALDTTGTFGAPNGIIGYSSTAFAGGFNITGITGTSKPNISNAINSLNFTVATTGAWTDGNRVVFTLSDQGYSFSVSGDVTLASEVTAHTIDGNGTITFQSFIDRTNSLNGTSGVGVSTTGLQGPFNMPPGVDNTASTNVSLNGETDFSLTNITTFTALAAGTSASIDNSTVGTILVPAPAGLVLLLSGVSTLSLEWLRRRWFSGR